MGPMSRWAKLSARVLTKANISRWTVQAVM
jgi:hypothetical protein